MSRGIAIRAVSSLIVLLLLGTGRACASLDCVQHPGGVGFDLDGSPTRCIAAIPELLSDDAAEWREAQARLACAGPACLVALDDPRVLESATGRRRACEVMRIALLMTVTMEDVGRHPRVLALIADSVTHAARLLDAMPKPTVMFENIYFPGPGLFWMDEQPNPTLDRLSTAFGQALSTGGFLVPAALKRLHDPAPVERGVACRVLQALKAYRYVDRLDSLVSDRAGFTADHDDYSTLETVGQTAGSVADRMRENSVRCWAFEQRLEPVVACGPGRDTFSLLVNGIRQSGNSLRARSWDEWWDAARPMWRVFWHMTLADWDHFDSDRWHNSVRAFEGFHLTLARAADARTSLVIKGPPGTTCRVDLSGQVLGSGPAPLRVTPPDTMVARLTRYPSDSSGAPSPYLLIEAWLPDGRHWSKSGWTWGVGSDWVLEVLPEPASIEKAALGLPAWKHSAHSPAVRVPEKRE